MTRPALLLALLLVPGCTFGTRESNFRRPGGETVTMTMSSGIDLSGELLEVRPTGLLVRRDRIQEFPWQEIRSASFDRLGKVDWPRWSRPGGQTLQRIRLVSRFPQGLDETTTRRLLDAYDQDAVQRCRTEETRLVCETAP